MDWPSNLPTPNTEYLPAEQWAAPTVKDWAGMTETQRQAWYCFDWEEEEHLCGNPWCPGCE